jgi:hypothetical protein
VHGVERIPSGVRGRPRGDCGGVPALATHVPCGPADVAELRLDVPAFNPTPPGITRAFTVGCWSGRREAPRAARNIRLAPVSSRPPINRTLGFPQSGWKRAHISDRVPHRVRGDGLLDQPTCRRQLAGWLAAFAAARGPDHEARSHIGTAPRRVIAASGTTPGLSCKRRPRSPRGPLLERGCVVLAVIAHTASAASLEPSRRLPVLRLYAESLPYGQVLAGLQTFPTLRRRSFPWCHCLYAAEPCGCSYPIPSPQTLAFALF